MKLNDKMKGEMVGDGKNKIANIMCRVIFIWYREEKLTFEYMVHTHTHLYTSNVVQKEKHIFTFCFVRPVFRL